MKGKIEEGLDSKIKLSLYNTLNFGKKVEFKKYLHGLNDAGPRLCRSGTNGLNEELGRHRGREAKKPACCVVLNMRVLVMCYGIV